MAWPPLIARLPAVKFGQERPPTSACYLTSRTAAESKLRKERSNSHRQGESQCDVMDVRLVERQQQEGRSR